MIFQICIVFHNEKKPCTMKYLPGEAEEVFHVLSKRKFYSPNVICVFLHLFCTFFYLFVFLSWIF